ncbi:MAG: fibronectin type III domain-containing protein, partial [Candidatus Heimdallarchaeota archaeon]
MSQYDWLRKWVADYKEKTGINVESPLKPIDYGLQYIKLGDYWATQYKYFPTDVRFEGSMNERITHLKQRGYGNDMINYWIIEGDKLVNEHKRSLERTKKPDSVFVSDHSVYSDPTKYLVHGLIPSIPSVQAATAVRVPDSVSISVSPSENTVLLNLTPHKDGGSPILSYHIILRNQTTGQEIRLTLHQTTRTLIQNLDSGTNYTVYAIAV